MSNWIARIFKGADPKPTAPGETAVAARPDAPADTTQAKGRIEALSVDELKRELETFGYKIVEKDGHHLVSHARQGKFQRHAYDTGDLALILRKEIAEAARAR